MTESRFAAPAWKVAFALAVVYVVWGSTYLAMAIAIETIPPLLMAGVRYVIAGSLLYAWARATGAPRPQLVHWRSALVVGGLLLLGGNGGVVWSEQRVPSGIAALLVSITPLWMVLMEWLRPKGHRPGLLAWSGLGLGLVGLVMLVRPSAEGRVDPLGVAVLIFATFSWAAGSLSSRSLPLPGSPQLATAMQMLAGSVLLTAFGLATGEAKEVHLAAISFRSVAALAYLITFGALLGLTAYVWLLRVVPPVLVGTYAYVNPIVAVFLGWLILHEPVTGRTLVAAAVILAGVVLITLSHRPAAKPREQETEALPEGERQAA